MNEIVMPRLSDSMEEGTILRWLKAPGDTVHRGDPLVEIETDKANMTYEADAEGELEIVAPEGDTLPIGSLIARLNGSDEAASAASESASVVMAPGEAARVKASPVARRLARERGVDLAEVQGTGPGGRVVRADVERPAAREPQGTTGTSEDPEPTTSPTTAKGQVTIQQLTRTQQVIARRMAESRATIPDFTLTTDVDMEAAADLRRQFRQMAHDVLPSYNDMVVRACAVALREHPRANGSYRDAHFELHERVNVGIAVAAADSLVVPTVFDADTKDLRTIASEARTLAERVRDATITPPELSGATFTVSNLGMFGVTSFTAVIASPQAAILAVGSVGPRAVAHEGGVVVRQTMSVTLSCDHRILYGAQAAEFLARVRDLLERPLELLLSP